MVFCYQNCSDPLWEKIVLVIEKMFWNSRLRAENFPPYLADQLTLFQPERADYPHLLLLAPPIFFTFRHHCSVYFVVFLCNCKVSSCYYISDAGRWKIFGVSVVIGGDNLSSQDGIGLTDLPNIGGSSGPPAPGSGITVYATYLETIILAYYGWKFRWNKVWILRIIRWFSSNKMQVTDARAVTGPPGWSILILSPDCS